MSLGLRNLAFLGGLATGPTLWTFDQITTSLLLKPDASKLFGSVIGGSNVSTGNTFARWDDMKANGISATQAVSSMRLTYDATGFNGLPCVVGSGNSAMILPTLPLLTTAGAGVIFYVFSINNDDEYGVVAGGSHWDRYGDGSSYPELFRSNRLTASLSMPTSGQHIICIISNPAVPQYAIRQNGAQIYTNANSFTFANNVNGIGTGHNANSTIAIGAPSLNGRIRAIAVIPGVVALSDIEKAEGHLADESLMTSVLPANHPYKSAPPTV